MSVAEDEVRNLVRPSAKVDRVTHTKGDRAAMEADVKSITPPPPSPRLAYPRLAYPEGEGE